MGRSNGRRMRSPSSNEIWKSALKKLVELTSLEKISQGLDLNDEDLKNLKWVCAYSEMGYNPPPRIRKNETECSKEDIESAMQLMALHRNIDPDVVSEIALEIQ